MKRQQYKFLKFCTRTYRQNRFCETWKKSQTAVFDDVTFCIGDHFY